MRQPEHDHLAATPVDWVDLPLGPGQENTNRGTLQFTQQGDAVRRTDVRRKPDPDGTPAHAYVLHRPQNGAPA